MDERAEGRWRILVCDPIHEEGLALLRERAEVEVLGEVGMTPAELQARIGDYDAVIVRGRTPVPAAALARAGRLRVIGKAGVGLDTIDVAAAEARGIAVLNCPEASTVAVAELTLALMLALARPVATADASMKAGRWEKATFKGINLEGKTLGAVGFGRIGRAVAQRALAFAMCVVVAQPSLAAGEAQAAGVEKVTLPELLGQSDFVTLHVPLRPENVGLMGAAELALMKPAAYLINTARGGLVDEAALLEALNGGRLAGAGLDVFTAEPEINWALAAHPRVVATPHLGASTEDAQRAAGVMIAEKVLEALAMNIERVFKNSR